MSECVCNCIDQFVKREREREREREKKTTS